MGFKGCAPGKVETGKPKIMLSGESGVGKTWFATSFPSVFYIDTERGSDLPHYQQRLKENGAWYMGPEHGSLDFGQVIDAVKELATTKHHYRTLVIDSFTKLYLTAAGIAEDKGGSEFGRDKKEANKPSRRLIRRLDQLDMNVILICHSKKAWKDGELVGNTFDGYDKLEYELHLWLEARKQGKSRLAAIRKSRMIGFEQDTTLPLEYEEFAKRYGKDIIEADAQSVEMAKPAQIVEITKLMQVLRTDDGWLDKCLSKAGAEAVEDLTADQIGKMIASLNSKLSTQTVAA